ncbi:hypothetical protein IWX49DRAFT_333381 [Phyllosticta citricarpa]
MSNQGYYQGGPQYPPQSYGPPQPGYGQPPYGGYPQQPVPSPTSPWIQAPSLTRSVQMQYQQGPPQQVIVKEKKDRGCLGTCLAVLCCCFVCEEGCECCAECCEVSQIRHFWVSRRARLTRL